MSRTLAAALALVAASGLACQRDADDPCAPSIGRWVAYASAVGGDWNIHASRLDGSCRTALSSDAALDANPAWSATGLVAYESDRAPFTSVWLHDTATRLERRLDVGALRASSPAFSPDGAALAFEGRYASSTSSSIYVVAVEGGTPLELTPETTPHGNGGPVFSPDGATVYFVSDRNGPYEVFRVPARGGSPVQVTTGSGILGKATVSPDGTTLAWTRRAGATTEVVQYVIATGTTTPLGVPSAAEPAYDPAGGRLAVRVLNGARANIALAPTDGGPPTLVTSGPGPDGAPAVGPVRW